MNKYKKRIKRAVALALAVVTAATSSGLDWGTLQTEAGVTESYMAVSSVSKISANKVLSTTDYQELKKVEFKVAVPSQGTATVGYEVKIYDLGDSTSYPTGGSPIVSVPGTATFTDGNKTASSNIRKDAFLAAAPAPDSTPTPEPEPTPEPDPEPTPDPTPGSTPEPGSEPTPDSTPTPDSNPDPEVDPDHTHLFTYTYNNDDTHTYSCDCGESETEDCTLTYTSEGDFHHTKRCSVCGYEETGISCDDSLKYVSNEDGKTHTMTCSLCGDSEVSSCVPVEDGTCKLCGQKYASGKKSKGGPEDTMLEATISVDIPAGTKIAPNSHVGVIVTFTTAANVVVGGAGGVLDVDGYNSFDGGGVFLNIISGSTTAPQATSIEITAPTVKDYYVDVTSSDATVNLTGNISLPGGRVGSIEWESSLGTPFGGQTSTRGNSVTATIPAGASGDYVITAGDGAGAGGPTDKVTIHALKFSVAAVPYTFERAENGAAISKEAVVTIDPAVTPDSTSYVGADSTGTASVTVVVGNLTRILTYDISKHTLVSEDIDSTKLSVNATTDTVVYTGTKYALDRDFTAEIVEKTASGSDYLYKVKLTGINNCEGSVEIDSVRGVIPSGEKIDINRVIAARIDGSKFIYNHGDEVNAPVKYYDMNGVDVTASFAGNVDVEYTGNRVVGTATAKVKAKDGTNYKGEIVLTYRIRPYDLDVNNDKVVVTFDNSIGEKSGRKAYRYTGSNVEPTFSVKVDGHTLDSNMYTPTFLRNKAVGTAILQITGEGNYSGTYDAYFEIVPNMLANGSVYLYYNGTESGADIVQDGPEYVAKTSLNVEYTGAAVVPTVSVYAGNRELAEGSDKDYTIESPTPDAINAGEKRIKIVGQGLYAGQSAYVTYNITPYDISKSPRYAVSIDSASQSFIYNGDAQAPADTEYHLIKSSGPKTKLTVYDDFTVTLPSDAINAGVKTVTLTGVNNFKGSVTANYEITKLDIGSCTIETLNDKPYDNGNVEFTYTGSEIKPTAKLKFNGREIYAGFTLEKDPRDDWKSIGTQRFILKGNSNNFTGTQNGQFKIVTQTLDNLKYYVGTDECTKIESRRYSTNYAPEYDGTVKPLKNLAVYDGVNKLVFGRDYEVTLPSSAAAGKHTVKIKGLGNYEDATPVQIEYNVKPVDLSSSRIKATVTGYTTVGGKIYPTLTIIDSGKKSSQQLREGAGADYTISSDVRAAGLDKDATVIAVENGNYIGSLNVKFNAGDNIADGTVSMTGKGVQKGTGAIANYNVMYGVPDSAITYEVTVNGKTYNADNFTITKVSTNYADVVNSHNDTNVVKVTLEGKGTELFGTTTVSYLILRGDLAKDITGVKDYTNPVELNLTYTGSAIDVTSIEKPLNYSTLKYEYGDLQSGDISVTPGTVGPGSGTGYILIEDASGNFKNSYKVPYTITVDVDNTFDVSELPGDTGNKAEYYYTGYPIYPDVTVKDKKRPDKTLVKGVDYKIDYINNKEIGTNTAQIKITGLKDYAGAEKVLTFSIVKIDLAKAKTAGKLKIRGNMNYAYTGDAITPSGYDVIYVGADSSETILKPGVDYDALPESNSLPGPHDITIKAVDSSDCKYINSVSFPYVIFGNIANKTLFTIDYGSTEFTINPDVAQTLSGVSIKINDKDGNYIDRNLETAYYDVESKVFATPGDYTLKINGKSPYSTGSVSIPVTVKADGANISVELTSDAFPYQGVEVKPTPTIYYTNAGGSKTRLTANVIEDITYINNKIPGTATIKVKLKDGYVSNTNEVSTNFNIYYDIAAAIVVPDYKSVDYDGTAKEPGVKLYVDEAKTIQIPESSYSVSWKNNIEAGNAEINVTAAGPNAKNTHAPVTFKINGQSIEGATIDPGTIVDKTYTGTAIEPPISKVLYNGNELVLNKDYTILYRNNTNVTQGTGRKATVTILGKGSFTGEKTLSFDIVPFSLANLTDSDVDIVDAVYAGDDRLITPEFTIKYNGITLTEGKDFKVELGSSQTVSANNSITFKGQGNFTGQKTFKFRINAADLDGSYMVLGTDKVEYTGAPVDPTVSISTNLSGTTYKLQKGKDYVIDSIKDSSGFVVYNPSNVGEYTVVARGQGNFTGSVTRSFEITKADLNSKKASDPTQDRYSIKFIDHEDRNYPMDGSSAYEPKLEIRDLTAGTILTEGVDYNLTYLNNTASGSMDDANPPTVIITASNDAACNYKGERIEKFNIGTSIVGVTVETNAPELGYMYDGKPHVPTLETVTYTDGAGVEHVLVRNRDYELVPTDRETTINAGTVPYVIKGIGEYYGTYSTEYKINPKVVNDSNISDIVITLSYPKDSAGYYTIFDSNPPYEPELTVYDYSVSRTTPLVEGVDYFEVTSANYHNNMTVRNDAYAEIKFGVPGSNYSVQSSAVNSPKYRILSRAITGDFTVKLKDPNLNREYIYNEDKGYYYTDAYNYYHGTPVIPEFEVYYKQDYDSEPIRLRYGSDYTLVQDTATYDYAYPGAHTIKVSGYDNYSGELDITYLITGNLADATIDVTDTYYTGEAAQPPVKVYFDDPVAGVVDNNDLEITYSPTDIHNPLVGRVDIKQKDGVVYLGGTNSQAYTLQWDPSVFTLVPDQVAFGYTGKPITPIFKVVTTGGAEIPINQSDIVYSQNGVINEHTNRGKVKAELNLKVGEKTVPLTTYFTIVAGSLDESCITAPTWLAYQGGANVVNARTITVKNKDNVVLTKGKDYDYTLTNAGGPGDCIVTFTTPPDSNYEILGSLTKTINIKPTAPGNLDSVPGSEDGTEVIYWTKVLYADGYEVTVYDGASEYGRYTVNAPTVNKIVTGLDSGKDYSATVKAFVKDASGNKYFSEASSIMFTTDIGKATGTVTPGSTAGTADIIFNPNSGGTSVYIYRSEDNNKYKLVAIYPKSYVKYTDNKLTSGKTYYYKMQEAYYINGSVVKSDLSDAYSVTIK